MAAEKVGLPGGAQGCRRLAEEISFLAGEARGF